MFSGFATTVPSVAFRMKIPFIAEVPIRRYVPLAEKLMAVTSSANLFAYTLESFFQ